ncbi:MAG: serine/threonine protein kinase [Myxococcales bacterium]|nr:MAG: serine/threonine protein kinase [Myxococcales bacterium]
MVDRIGNCRILSEIGSGGMATVYKAVQEPLGRTVAIKALKPSIAVDSQFAKRFEREAHFMASLQHENILHVHDFIKERGTMYIIMEYVEGIDLYDLLERTPRLPVEVAAIIALQVVRALDYAHFRGIIHRDIKPANVIISHRGEVKLMDFGIARDDTLADLTETGTGLGTPSYMSPEQILGDKLDFRSDIFSLGIVLYQMVVGRKPFVEDDTRTVMQKIRLDRYTSPRKVSNTVPRALERILARCMEKMPANRYPSTQSLIDDLTEFLATRITTNYNAHMVTHLRDVGAISEVEAEEILAAGAPRGPRNTHKDRGLLKQMTIVQGVLLIASIASGAVIQVANDGFDRQRRSRVSSMMSQSPTGYLQIVVDPWAEVFVDGQRLAITPIAKPISIAPGKHYIQLKNPYYMDGEHEVDIKKDEIKRLEVKLKRATSSSNTEDEGSDK